MVRLGFQQEDRRFTPHLTLGRIKHLLLRGSWMRALEGVKDITLPGFEVTAISLMKSELKPTGAVYTEIGRAELSSKGSGRERTRLIQMQCKQERYHFICPKDLRKGDAHG